MSKTIDLMQLTENGGCSAKLPAAKLQEIVSQIPVLQSENLLVGNDTADDALVYRIDAETALIQTIDFFPPLCPDPFDFGQIAAANALSDIFAMGGTPLTALNVVMFPSAHMDISILQEILQGGAEKVKEAGAVLAGGHTIDGDLPVYGLSVTGRAHPRDIITNAAAKPDDLLVLTKGIGTGIITAAQRIGEASKPVYNSAVQSMKQLHGDALPAMREAGVSCATDITGFSLAGHALEMAKASGVTFSIDSSSIPLLPGVNELLELGCIPGAAFRNLSYVDSGLSIADSVAYNRKMACVDAQTSGGLLLCVKPEQVEALVQKLLDAGYAYTAIIGAVQKRGDTYIELY